MSAAVLDKLGALSDYAKRLLTQPPEPSEAPIRAELFGRERFEQHGRSLARAQLVDPDRQDRAHTAFFPQLDSNIESLRQAYDYIALTSTSGRYVAPAAEWLLDNFHLIEAQLQQIRSGVPRSYYRRLPKLASPPLAGLPRVYGIAWAYVAHTDSVLNAELFTAFLDAYQEVDELTLGELWALPTTLRVVLLENLRRVAESIASIKVARELAHAVWDRAAVLSDADLDVVYRAMQSRGLQDSYLTQLWLRLPVERGEHPPALARWTEQHCPSGPGLISEAQAGEAAANLTVGNIVTTLRLIGQVEWADLIEPVSCSLRVLRQLPSFARESESTRQQITHAMEQLARQTEHSERRVAEAVLALAQAAALRTEPGANVSLEPAELTAGHYLIGDGRPDLRAVLQPGGAGRISVPDAGAGTAGRGTPRLALYLLVVLGGTALLLALAVHGLHRLHAPAPAPWGLGLLAALALLAFPLSEAVMALVHRILAESTPVQALPRLDFADGIPAAHRVLVAIPSMLGSPAATGELARRLELHWLANREPNAQFALVSDFNDAASATLPGDAALLADARAQIDRLNALYPGGEGSARRFLLLHRPRTWCDTEQRWMGWERKRGKLEMLLRLMATGDGSGFLPETDIHRLAPGTPYVVTLDADTGLPPGSLRELVAVASHPLNQPRIDIERRRVVAGFGILQPRIVTPFPLQAERSPFHWLFAGQCGLDPYSSAASDIYQDVFGVGSFTGKGLLNVRAVHAVLDRRLPDGAVLSHDLLEGSVARCGVVSDLALLEDHPHHSGVAASRVHRWTRGDWQLLPLMLRAGRFGIDALGFWKMLDNLRRTLVLPASTALLVATLFTEVLPLGWVLAAVGAALALGPLLGALAGLVPTRRSIELRHFFDVGARDLLRAAAGAAWQFVQLFAQSWRLMDATVRALWRLAASRRHLLEWTTAAQAQAQARYGLSSFLRADAAPSALALVLAVLAAVLSPHPMLAPALFVLWAAAPLLAWRGSQVPRPSAGGIAQLPSAQRDYLLQLARDTWQFFE
ncbi:MAG: hypothetical protein EOO24_12105, partial [Comamonadaceae bacterium]